MIVNCQMRKHYTLNILATTCGVARLLIEYHYTTQVTIIIVRLARCWQVEGWLEEDSLSTTDSCMYIVRACKYIEHTRDRVVSWVSAHGHLNITHKFGPHGCLKALCPYIRRNSFLMSSLVQKVN